MKNKQSGFTLAEVLITLTVIGVVAALSIPTLLSSSNDAGDVTRLKKVYATFTNAAKLYEAEEGSISSAFTTAGGASSGTASKAAFEAVFMPYLNIIKYCGADKGCWHDGPTKHLGGTQYHATLDTQWDGNYAKAILADGITITFSSLASNCTTDNGDGPLDNTCGNFVIDINGSKGPNQVGRDYFDFWITRSGVYPMGSYNDGKSCSSSSSTWDTEAGCTAKILAEGEINY